MNYMETRLISLCSAMNKNRGRKTTTQIATEQFRQENELPDDDLTDESEADLSEEEESEFPFVNLSEPKSMIPKFFFTRLNFELHMTFNFLCS